MNVFLITLHDFQYSFPTSSFCYFTSCLHHMSFCPSHFPDVQPWLPSRAARTTVTMRITGCSTMTRKLALSWTAPIRKWLPARWVFLVSLRLIGCRDCPWSPLQTRRLPEALMYSVTFSAVSPETLGMLGQKPQPPLPVWWKLWFGDAKSVKLTYEGLKKQTPRFKKQKQTNKTFIFI